MTIFDSPDNALVADIPGIRRSSSQLSELADHIAQASPSEPASFSALIPQAQRFTELLSHARLTHQNSLKDLGVYYRHAADSLSRFAQGLDTQEEDNAASFSSPVGDQS